MPGSRIEGLKELRARRGISVAQLAKLAKVSDHIVHQLESGATAEPREVTRILGVVSEPQPSLPDPPESGSRGVGESEEQTDGRDTAD